MKNKWKSLGYYRTAHMFWIKELFVRTKDNGIKQYKKVIVETSLVHGLTESLNKLNEVSNENQ